MAALKRNRILIERAVPGDEESPGYARARTATGKRARSVTVNLAESPLGWLRARGHVSAGQFDAGERLRADWERAQLGPSLTMKWDAPPLDKTARGAPEASDPTTAQIAAKRRFDAAVTAVGPGLGDVLWRIVCAGEGMRDAERALGWPARAGKLVLGLALDRLADFYRLPRSAEKRLVTTHIQAVSGNPKAGSGL
ncbi:MAG: DUF6456 domain-containing protein [Propylenella sp.]